MEIDIGSARNDDQSKDVVVEYNIDTEGNHHGNSLHDNNKLINNEKIHIDRRKMRFKLFPEKGNWQKEISDNDHDDEEAETENKAFKSCITETKENLMKFAEILYKCTLCTSMPSILTSESSFVSHVIEEHLKKHVSSISCPQCELGFGTEEDLKFHISFSHADSSLSSIENFISVKSEEKCSELPFSQLWSVNKEGCVPKSLDLSKCIKKRKSRQALGSHSFPESNSINNMNDTECSPKITISHEPENPHRNVPMENRVKLQELTNEIFTKQKDVGSLHIGVDVSQIGAIKNVSSTPEFGKYTKLVREGGSIVYFCQVCNWKSQIKVHFDGHCKNKVHQTKVKVAEEQRTADQNDIEKRKQELPFSLVNKSEVLKVKKLDVPNLTENQNSEDEEKKCQSVQRTKRVSPARPNKRKRSSANVVRYYDHNNDWNSSDSNSSNSSYFIPMRESSLEQVTKMKKSKLCSAQSPQSLVKQEIDVISPKAKEMSPLQTLLHSNHNKFQPNQFVSSKAVFPEFQATSTSYGSRKTSSPVTSTGSALLNQLLSLTPKFSSSPFSSPTMPSRNDTKENDKHYDDLCKVQTEIPEIPSSDLKSERESPKMHCTEVPIMQHSESATKPSQEDSSHHFTSLQSGLNKCGFCPKTFESDTILRLHLERCHLKRFDEVFQVNKSSDDPQKEGFGEVSKIIKLKLVIPNLLFSTPHGNVSREQLLQKFSELTDINEAVQWGPACNKAIRELFPDSTAQRKGKYKKTYYFGISFTEPPNGETEDLSDSEQTPFQSLRDVSYDLDRILQHLHNILEWSGDMTQGVVREDLLSVLGTQLQDSEMQQRGTLCNKAVRGAFPNVKMMRKGKFKTVYFGVRFQDDVTHLIPESNISLSPLLMSCRGPKKKTVENETQNRYNETHWNSGSSDITEQRAKKGYAPLSGLYNAASKYSSYSSEIGCESTKELKVEPCDYTSGSSELHSLGFGDNWPRYKALETLKSRLAAKSAVSKVLPSYMEQLREVTGERLDIKQEIVDEKEYNIGMLNSYANERQDEEIMHAGVDRKHNMENVYGNTGCFGDTETGETTLNLNKSLTIPMKKELEASSDEDDNNDNCDDDDADDERSASPSIPEGDETLDDPATKSSLIMRFRRKSSTSNGKVYSTF